MSMDTIDGNVMAAVCIAVEDLKQANDLLYIHTVKIELNGAHGGADVHVIGFEGNDVSLYNERKFTAVVH